MLNDRYERLRQLDWWKADLVTNAVALVAGAGALGNEVIKNLLLLGWGRIIVADFDLVEASNLAKSILYSSNDIGLPKALSIEKKARTINPDCRIIGLHDDIRLSLSAGIVSRCDVVFGCLDNVSARLSLGVLTRQSGIPFIDGGLSVWDGSVTSFWPSDNVCYACTITDDDIKDLNLRRSCAIYAQKVDASKGIPTTPTIGSVIGAFMAQQALKWIHGSVDSENHIKVDMAYNRIWNMNVPTNPDCRFHQNQVSPDKKFELKISDTWGKILLSVKEHYGDFASIRLPIPVLTKLECPQCSYQDTPLSVSLPGVRHACPKCSAILIPTIINQINDTSLYHYSPLDFKFPLYTWLTVVSEGASDVVFELGGGSGRLKKLITR